MNYTRIALAAVAATVVYFIYGFLVEGLLIRKDFLPYTSVYRSAEAVKPLMPLGMLCTLVALSSWASFMPKATKEAQERSRDFVSVCWLRS